MTGKKLGPFWCMVESGPPIIWIPRVGLTRFATSYFTRFRGLSFGLGWWIVTVGFERRLPDSPVSQEDGR